jgi:hypothetical protein
MKTHRKPSFAAMLRGFAAVALAISVAGCASSSGLVGSTEAYRGQLAAAVTPVRMSGAAGVSFSERERIQARLVRELDAAGIFATVVPLSSPQQANEVEVIVDPTILDASQGSGGLERLTLGVRAKRKGTGEIGLDDRFKGRASRKGDALADLMPSLTKRLKRQYGQPPVY